MRPAISDLFLRLPVSHLLLKASLSDLLVRPSVSGLLRRLSVSDLLFSLSVSDLLVRPSDSLVNKYLGRLLDFHKLFVQYASACQSVTMIFTFDDIL